MAEIRNVNIDKEFIVKFGVCRTNISDDMLPIALEVLSKAIKEVLQEAMAEDGEITVAPVKHGHIVWKEYHKGGIRRRKCLQEIKSVYIEQQMPCKHIAITDERYLSKDPYCSECGKLLGEFLNYCGNCGAKMDGGENNGT